MHDTNNLCNSTFIGIAKIYSKCLKNYIRKKCKHILYQFSSTYPIPDLQWGSVGYSGFNHILSWYFPEYSTLHYNIIPSLGIVHDCQIMRHTHTHACMYVHTHMHAHQIPSFCHPRKVNYNLKQLCL